MFRGVPAGEYYLSVEYELGRDRNAAVFDAVEIVRNPATWSNYALLMIFLAAFPLFSRWRRNAFEAHRWQESDIGGGDDSDGDEDD